jgi:hypothetical protein
LGFFKFFQWTIEIFLLTLFFPSRVDQIEPVAGGVRCAERGREHHGRHPRLLARPRLPRRPACSLARASRAARPARSSASPMAAAWPELAGARPRPLPLGRSSPAPSPGCSSPELARALAWPQLPTPSRSELARAHGPAWLELGRALPWRAGAHPRPAGARAQERRRRAARVDVGQARTPPSSRAQRWGQRRRSGTEAGGMRSRGGRRHGTVEGRGRSNGGRGSEQGRSGPQQGTAVAGVGEGGRRRRSVDSVGGRSR